LRAVGESMLKDALCEACFTLNVATNGPFEKSPP